MLWTFEIAFVSTDKPVFVLSAHVIALLQRRVSENMPKTRAKYHKNSETREISGETRAFYCKGHQLLLILRSHLREEEDILDGR